MATTRMLHQPNRQHQEERLNMVAANGMNRNLLQTIRITPRTRGKENVWHYRTILNKSKLTVTLADLHVCFKGGWNHCVTLRNDARLPAFIPALLSLWNFPPSCLYYCAACRTGKTGAVWIEMSFLLHRACLSLYYSATSVSERCCRGGKTDPVPGNPSRPWLQAQDTDSSSEKSFSILPHPPHQGFRRGCWFWRCI